MIAFTFGARGRSAKVVTGAEPRTRGRVLAGQVGHLGLALIDQVSPVAGDLGLASEGIVLTEGDDSIFDVEFVARFYAGTFKHNR